MNLEELNAQLNELVQRLPNDKRTFLDDRLGTLVSAFPFNEYEYILTYLVDQRVLLFEEYEQLRNDYVSGNRYLNLYSLAPRVFGQVWGEKHLMELDMRFQKATKKLDPNFDGEYDLWIQGIRVEVKSARAIDTKIRGALSSKALRYRSNRPYWMNYQQLKLDICDVFVFIAVWVDQIEYWVMSNNEIKSSPYLSPQHRGGIEYQIGFRNNNINEFNAYKVEAEDVADTVIRKGTERS